MITLYRGCRLKFPEDLKRDGMRYYWESPRSTIADIFELLRQQHRLNALETSTLVRSYIIEAAAQHRIQIWATTEKDMADSYARNSPEIIGLVLGALNLQRQPKSSVIDTRKVLQTRYGTPFVVEFSAEETDVVRSGGTNIPCGTRVPKERIVNVYPVDLSTPDPHIKKFFPGYSK